MLLKMLALIFSRTPSIHVGQTIREKIQIKVFARKGAIIGYFNSYQCNFRNVNITAYSMNTHGFKTIDDVTVIAFFSKAEKLKIAAVQGRFCSVSRSEKLCNSAYTLFKFDHGNIYTSMIKL